MNLIGISIGIVFWSLVLWFIPDPPWWVRIPIRTAILVLIILGIARIYQRWLSMKKKAEE